MGWTDHLAALQLAQAEIEPATGRSRPAIILLTDGKPEWADTISNEQKSAYLAALQTQNEWFAANAIPLFIILLSNETTDRDTDIAEFWRPLWQEMSQTTPPGRFYTARTARDLPHIYHDMVVSLTGRQTNGVVLEMQTPEGGAEATLIVPEALAQLTLVISKGSPDQQISIKTETGQELTPGSPQIRRAGGSEYAAEEVWVFDEPQPGSWQIRITKPGNVTIWQDYKRLPATALPGPQPSPALTAAPSPKAAPTNTAVPTAAPTVKTAVIASITPQLPVQPSQPPPKRAVWTWWVWGGLLMAVAAAIGGVWRHRFRQPLVSGTLRVLGGDQPLRVIDLDNLGKTAVSLGKAPADIPLRGAAATAAIVPGARVDNARQMFIRSDGRITLNGRPIPPSAALTDAALIDLGGGVQLRYENLRLRRAGRFSRREKGEGRS
jgi:hypothetical protein